MPEDLNQKISQFLDDELDHNDALHLLKKMQSEPELQDKFSRYQAISHAMKTETFLLTKTDFSTKIRQQIQQEPVYLLPQKKSFQQNHKKIAMAASIALVAVITGRYANNPSQHPKAASTALQVAQNQLPDRSGKPVDATQYPLNKRINDYLQAHNSSVYTNGEANFQPFARVTSYSRK
ncbi:MAG: sigma-E factor negative regulatory protein [Methylococcales bacterium]|nr:sigma-E factor negative regulatory protein [Methylococcales bacterium]